MMRVTTSDLSRAYGRHLALDGANLTFSTGLCGLLGPNGAGKTTLLRLLAALLRPTKGRVFYDHLDLSQNQPAIRRILGYLPQEFGFYRQLTGFEFLDFAAAMKGFAPGRERRRRIAEAIEWTSLGSVADRRIGTYSGGMRQRLGIAQALLGQPEVLILDEPTVGLDPEERIRFRTLLGDLARTRTVILSTHVVSDIETSCDHLAVIRSGKVVYAGEPDGLAAMAAGRVYQYDAPAGEVPPAGPWTIVSSRQIEGGTSYRLLTWPGRAAPGSPLEPRLEDGYLCLGGDDPEKRGGRLA